MNPTILSTLINGRFNDNNNESNSNIHLLYQDHNNINNNIGNEAIHIFGLEDNNNNNLNFNHLENFINDIVYQNIQQIINHEEDRDIPTDPKFIKNLPIVNIVVNDHNKKKECAICKDKFSETLDHSILKLPCKHLYHQHCIVLWLQRKNTCPECRMIFPKQSNIVS